MFVARVLGDSMEPEIPNGAYCLFRPARPGSRCGRRLLVWHAGIDDPHTGGQYTVKVYTSERRADPDADWQHTRIVLRPLNLDYEPIVLTPEDEERSESLPRSCRCSGSYLVGPRHVTNSGAAWSRGPAE